MTKTTAAIYEAGTLKLEEHVDLDERTRVRVSIELPDDTATHQHVDKRLYGHSIQGTLYELADRDYDNPEAKISFEVDSHDGMRWICHMDRSQVPERFERHWRSLVFVEGIATFHPRKPEMEVSKIRFLKDSPEPIKALERLIGLTEGMMADEGVQQFMDRVRERD